MTELDLMAVPSATATWWALPEGKRQRIEDAAITTFTIHGYDQASLTRLVADLGIAKGSIYQYFEGGKLGLFVHLLQEAVRRKLAAVQPELPRDGDPELAQLRALYVRGLSFWRSEPRWAALLLSLERPSREPALAMLSAKAQQSGRDFLRERLRAGQQAGTVRDDIPLDALTELVHATVSVGLRRLLFERARVQLADLPAHPLALSDDELITTVDHALAYVRHGALAP